MAPKGQQDRRWLRPEPARPPAGWRSDPYAYLQAKDLPSAQERFGQLSSRSLGRSRPRPQTRLPVLAVPLAELVEPAPADAGLPAQLGHRRLAPRGPIHERLPQACQTIRRGHGRSSVVDSNINSVRVSSGPFSMSAVSGLTVGCKD